MGFSHLDEVGKQESVRLGRLVVVPAWRPPVSVLSVSGTVSLDPSPTAGAGVAPTLPQEIWFMLVQNSQLGEAVLGRLLKRVAYTRWIWDNPHQLSLSLQISTPSSYTIETHCCTIPCTTWQHQHVPTRVILPLRAHGERGQRDTAQPRTIAEHVIDVLTPEPWHLATSLIAPTRVSLHVQV